MVSSNIPKIKFKTEVIDSRVKNDKFFKYSLLVSIALVFIGLVLKEIFLEALWISAAGLMGIVLFITPYICALQLYSHFFSSIEISDDKIIFKDYTLRTLFKILLKIDIVQVIDSHNIAMVYYLGKEAKFLRCIKRKLKIPYQEYDYTQKNLSARYGITQEAFNKIKDKFAADLDEARTEGLYAELEIIFDTYLVPKNEKKKILKKLEDRNNFNLDFLKIELAKYQLNQEDFASLEEEFKQIYSDNINPFLLTKINLKTYEKDLNETIGVYHNLVVIFSSEDGRNKAYYRFFHDLSIKDQNMFIDELIRRNPAIKIMITRVNHI